MAWIFSLSIECGPERAKAEALAAHFGGETSLQQDAEGAWWCVAAPRDLPRSGLSTDEDFARATVAGEALYDRLRGAPAYRYALAGLEVDQFRTCTELVAEGADLSMFDGLVLSDPVFEACGKPDGFLRFAEGAWWRPWRGARRG